jgi:hypothetical protein
MHIRALLDTDEHQYLSVKACAERMHTSTDRVRFLAQVGVLKWRRGPLGDIEVEPAIVRP